MTLLPHARADLQLEVGKIAVVVPPGQVFDYSDEVRKRVEVARADLFFVDPYMDADFVAPYMPFVRDGVTVGLLGRYQMASLLPHDRS